MADPGLDFGIQPALLAGCGILGLYIFHDLIHASPRVKSLKIQYLIGEFENFPYLCREANAKSAVKFQDRWNFYPTGE
jgi:hypothetical protein